MLPFGVTELLLLVWIILFVLFAIAGLVDFYLWGYDYGHNLSDDAAIKVPGMTYQPPLIGTKQLLNITASSWPGHWVLHLADQHGAGILRFLVKQTIVIN